MKKEKHVNTQTNSKGLRTDDALGILHIPSMFTKVILKIR